ncbi:Glutathione-binding protein GsiB precursor [Anaerohalosphaera lusitana]|uniref:Glutathione-binding protein GsiB n=1 Tax=Anaerohalosphaera lusitana TaxID=1936003 RepID=A0A1U9NNK5_9BACT|nr:ABC transporter substrate-binding protein [Anaerohalosphaera lusitana]AQT69377.1 Glutathione-binding protein GsiB precursor [Anaerohalosphaera lusitana]
MKFIIIFPLAVLAVLCIAAGFFAGCDTDSGKKPDEMVIRSMLNAKLKGLDPVTCRDVYQMKVGSQIYESLYDYHYLKRPYEPVPLLADGMPQISEDGLKYTIKIKKGVRYQDDPCFPDGKGRLLKASDFIFSLKRFADINNLSHLWADFDERIVGLDEFREYSKECENSEDVDYSRTIEGAQALDDHTLQFKLIKPWPEFIEAALIGIVMPPLPPEALEYYGEELIAHPVGTGAYMLKTWKRGSFIELVRNPNFRGQPYPSEGEEGDLEAGLLEDAGKMMPFAERIVYTVIEESQPSWLLFMNGDLDSTGIAKDNFDQAVAGSGDLTDEMRDRGVQLKTYLDAGIFWLGFNMEDPVLGNNKPLRMAISHAIDRQQFIDTFMNGRDMIANGILSQIYASYNPKIKDMGFSVYDPQKAKELLAEAEEVNGGPVPTLTISLPGTDSFHKQYGQFLNKLFSEIDLDVEIDYMDWPTYMQKLNTKSAQLFASGVSGGIPQAISMIPIFYSENASPGPNHFNYKNAEVDKLYKQVRVMFPSEEKNRLYQKIEKIVMSDYPAAFINQRVAYILHHGWYKNYKPNPFSYNTAKFIRIDTDARDNYKK